MSPSSTISTAMRSAAVAESASRRASAASTASRPSIVNSIVAQVAVVLLERVEVTEQLGVQVGEVVAEGGERLRMAGAGDDVLALCADEEVAVGGARHRSPGRA